jgi:hypothetical protein
MKFSGELNNLGADAFVDSPFSGHIIQSFRKGGKVIKDRKADRGMLPDLTTFLTSELEIFMPSMALTLLREVIKPRFYGTGLPAQSICLMLRREEWRASGSRNQQLLLLCDFAQNECARAPPAAIVA